VRPDGVSAPVAKGPAMNTLREALDDYLAIRRATGVKLERDEKLLGQFLGYCDQGDVASITITAVTGWVMQPDNAGASWTAMRLNAVRQFARWRWLTDPTTEIPPADLFGPLRRQRRIPFLYTNDDILALMNAAGQLRQPLRQVTYETFIGLLAVTGMRLSEAINVDRGDFDPANGWLQINDTKFGKSRQVALSASTVDALETYLTVRHKLCPNARTEALFISPAGTRLLVTNVQSTFRILVRSTGLKPRSLRCRPRMHDLRHTFAVATLLDWYRDGLEIERRLPILSTHLGHANPAATYWYLTAAPELMAITADRLAEHENRSTP